ncbi:MAG: MotA/TolQ/ExbB proton channel [Polyangiaceae bacterium]|jgi:biopolymer transport protein ExbB|nr:MotA/TolQ/ExbB proton channel [Polyangiaceae bacterium]
MDFSLLGLWNQMGIVARTVVLILLAMSAYSIAIALERFVTFRRSRQRSIGFVGALQPHLAPGGKLADARALPEKWKDAPLARVIGTGLGEYEQGLADLGPAATDSVELELLMHGVERSMERAKKRELSGLSRGLPVLATISSSAPFVGLFGTVFGIITAFQHMADPSKGGGGGLATVSAGIAEALLTTAVGLGVAIVTVWFYNFFTTKLDQLGGLIDDATGELSDRLMRHGKRGAGTTKGEDRAVTA